MLLNLCCTHAAAVQRHPSITKNVLDEKSEIENLDLGGSWKVEAANVAQAWFEERVRKHTEVCTADERRSNRYIFDARRFVQLQYWHCHFTTRERQGA